MRDAFRLPFSGAELLIPGPPIFPIPVPRVIAIAVRGQTFPEYAPADLWPEGFDRDPDPRKNPSSLGRYGQLLDGPSSLCSAADTLVHLPVFFRLTLSRHRYPLYRPAGSDLAIFRFRRCSVIDGRHFNMTRGQKGNDPLCLSLAVFICNEV